MINNLNNMKSKTFEYLNTKKINWIKQVFSNKEIYNSNEFLLKKLDKIFCEIESSSNKEIWLEKLKLPETDKLSSDYSSKDMEQTNPLFDIFTEAFAIDEFSKKHGIDKIEIIRRSGHPTPDFKINDKIAVEVKNIHSPRNEEIIIDKKFIESSGSPDDFYIPLLNKIHYACCKAYNQFKNYKTYKKMLVLNYSGSFSSLAQGKRTLDQIFKKNIWSDLSKQYQFKIYRRKYY